MLVFTRKIGQQVVLPDQDITIDIMEVGKTRVRLGISAPADIPVHRREVWDRTHGPRTAPAARGDGPSDRLATVESKPPTAPSSAAPPDLDECLAQWITARTGGRVSGLSVERVEGRIVIRGSVRSYYVRQLAQAAVKEVLGFCDGLPPDAVENNIDVAHVYYRSAGRAQGLTKLSGQD